MGPWLIEPDPLDKHWSPAFSAQGEVQLSVEDLPTPNLILDVDALTRNLQNMREWTTEVGVRLAPHGKTTMAPGLWHWQVDAGAWGISVANFFQLRVAHHVGIPRVLVANEFLSPGGLQWLSETLSITSAETFDVVCWADSVAGVELMEKQLTASGANRPLGVCVEIGALHGRTGIRAAAEARAVAERIAASEVLQLRGVAAYEGSVPAPVEGDHASAVARYVQKVRAVFTDLSDIYETAGPILTCGGSAWFDIVAEQLAPSAQEVPGTEVILRSGAFAIHDHGHYERVTPGRTRTGPRFVPSAFSYARVLSAPEDGLVVLDAGKRDIPYDIDLPRVLGVFARGTWREVSAEVFKTDDQHAYVRVDQAALKVGDLVRLGLSHPCTMFDKWRSVLLMEKNQLVGAVRTYF